MSTQAPLTLELMVEQMDKALSDEIKVHKRNTTGHIAVDGRLHSNGARQYIYEFTLHNPWEPQDDTPCKIVYNGAKEVKGSVVTSRGTTITIVTTEPLPDEALEKVTLVDDPTELLERLRETLKNNGEGSTRLGSKSFGLLEPFVTGERRSPVTFGTKFTPDNSQEQAIRMALGSEVTYIIGPPGTGKTVTLAAIAFAHLREGRTVLIAAHTNIAVDNAIMKLVDTCRETGCVQELKNNQIIRYGTAQLADRMESEYSEVHLPAIIAKIRGDQEVERQKNELYLTQIAEQLVAVEQEGKQLAEKWEAERGLFVTKGEALQKELATVQAREQQRLTALETHLRHYSSQLAQAQQRVEAMRQSLSHLEIEKARGEAAASHMNAQAHDLMNRLAEIQRMNAFMRTLKRTNEKQLAEKLANNNMQLGYCRQKLNGLQNQLQALYQDSAAGMKQVEELASYCNRIQEQITTPSHDTKTIRWLQMEVTNCEQHVAHGDTTFSQARENLSKGQKALLDEKERASEYLASLGKLADDLQKQILLRAKVVATTLCKIYMNANLRERPFDVVILDEVSMAPLPAVYIAASRAQGSVVLIGDPHQLAPICNAKESEMASQWLGRDLFAVRDIGLERAKNRYGNSCLLTQQARMHPVISKIAREHVYGGHITDRILNNWEPYGAVAPLPGRPLLLCDTSEAAPFTNQPEGRSRINAYHALCTLELARHVLKTLPERAELRKGEFRVGLVTPYTKQAELLQRLVKDAKLEDQVRAGTVHRFQGLEAEVIIFDTVESPPLSPRFTSGVKGSPAMRLVNVAVTRAQHKLIIVANSQYIQAKLHPSDILRLAVQEAQKAGAIGSQNILKTKLPPIVRKLQDEMTNATSGKEAHEASSAAVTYEEEQLDDCDFYERFEQDVRNAKKEVIIFSASLGFNRICELISMLRERCLEGIHIIAISSSSETSNPESIRQITLLKEAGVEVRLKKDMDSKFVFVDEDLCYLGSVNVLSHGGTNGNILRVKSYAYVSSLKKSLSFDSTMEKPVKYGPDILVYQDELLPLTHSCKTCGNTLTARIGKNGPFYGCENYWKNGCKFTEEVTDEHLSRVERLTKMKCGRCGKETRIETVRKDAWIECAAANPCGYGQRIVFQKRGR